MLLGKGEVNRYFCTMIMSINWQPSVQFSRSVVSDSLRPHESQHARPPCPSPTPGVHWDSRPSSWWCHPAISSSVVPFSSCPQSLPASESFPMSQLEGNLTTHWTNIKTHHSFYPTIPQLGFNKKKAKFAQKCSCKGLHPILFFSYIIFNSKNL